MMKYILGLMDWLKANLILASTPRRRMLFQEREIWWCSIGMNIGEEEFGKGPEFRRPVFILKKFTEHSFFGIPLTGSIKSGSWYLEIDVSGRRSCLMLNQGRMLDSQRLQRKMAKLDMEDMKEIKRRFAQLYGL